MRSSRAVRLAGVALALLSAAGARAQEDRGQQALARAQALLRQASSQKQELEAANVRLNNELETTKRKLAAAEAALKESSTSLASEQRRALRAGSDLEGARDRLTLTEERLRETEAVLRATRATLQEREQQLAEASGRTAQLEAELADSEHKNLALYQANVELLELYRNKGPITALLQHEPTGLKAVGIENILQEYRLKLDDSLAEANRRTAPSAPGAGGGAR